MFFCNTAVHAQLADDMRAFEENGGIIQVIPEGVKAEHLVKTENVIADKPAPAEILIEDENQDMSDREIAGEMFQDKLETFQAEY